MKVLVIGGGGREHALAWKISHSPRVDEVWCAPGNAGIARDVKTVPLNAGDERGIEEAVHFAKEQGIDLTVVGPEAPLVAGIVDRFEAEGLRIFGANRSAARLEGSKCFTKEFLDRHNIPTAAFRLFEEPEEARSFVRKIGTPIVIKADGLAAGKGVLIARDLDEALAAIDTIMVEKRFGEAGNRIIVEDFLSGTELTLIVLTDGTTVLPMETAQDYKPALDGNKGPNTGGMGSYSPHIALESPVISKVLQEVIYPTIEGLRAEGIRYCGALYAGLMLTEEGPSVLEYNVRFGDPEIQAILMRLRSDFVDLIEACVENRLEGVVPEWDGRHSVCVVAASEGYPGSYESGQAITGIPPSETDGGVKVFCAGTRDAAQAGRLETAGGRVLAVTALGDSLEESRSRAYEELKKVDFAGMVFRTDIGIPYGETYSVEYSGL